MCRVSGGITIASKLRRKGTYGTAQSESMQTAPTLRYRRPQHGDGGDEHQPVHQHLLAAARSCSQSKEIAHRRPPPV